MRNLSRPGTSHSSPTGSGELAHRHRGPHEPTRAHRVLFSEMIMDPDLDSLIGKTLSSDKRNKYSIMGKIGEGAQGAVYLAKKVTEQEEAAGRVDFSVADDLFAVKILPPGLAEQDQMVSRFLEEAASLSRIRSDGIVRLVDFGLGDDKHSKFFLVTPYIPGQGFDEILDTKLMLPLTEAVPYFIQTARILVATHAAKIVHRDLKPGNIRISPDGKVYLLDFGIAKQLEGSLTATAKDQTFGTPDFMSPEQFQSNSHVTATDIFSFGVIMYLSLTGELPFTKYDGTNLQQVTNERLSVPARPIADYRPDFPPVIAKMIMDTLNPVFNQRPNAENILQILSEFAAAHGLGASQNPAHTVAPEAISAAGPVDPTTESGSLAPKKRISRISLPTILGFAGVAVTAIGISLGIRHALFMRSIHSSPPPSENISAEKINPTNKIIISIPEGAELTGQGLPVYQSTGHDIVFNYPVGEEKIALTLKSSSEGKPVPYPIPNKSGRYEISEDFFSENSLNDGIRDGGKPTDASSETNGPSKVALGQRADMAMRADLAGLVGRTDLASGSSIPQNGSGSHSTRKPRQVSASDGGTQTSSVKIVFKLPVSAELSGPGGIDKHLSIGSPMEFVYPRGTKDLEFTIIYDGSSITKKVTPDRDRMFLVLEGDFSPLPSNNPAPTDQR
ncbi:serine/threonine protein kinase [Candidatus Micrarchaeota archaeon]|nr:serine/threonine protein kinase [Candidatus Micrarchaeota archaeon]